MKFWLKVFTFILCFNWTLAADNRLVEVDLRGHFNKSDFRLDSDYFLTADNWLYGQTRTGLPVYQQTFSVPTGLIPRIVDISYAALDSALHIALEELIYYNQVTDSENDYDSDLFGEIQFETIDDICLAVQKKYSTADRDYYDLLAVPFQSDDNSSVCRLYTELEIEIELVPGNESIFNINPYQPSMSRLLNKLSCDKSNPENNLIANQSLTYPDNPDYIVITNDSLASSFQPFVDWKRALGHNCRIKFVEDIAAQYGGIDLAAQIREYLKDAYLLGAEWVLLGGDETIIPVRTLYAANTNTEIPMQYRHASDLYYGDLTGEWDVDGDDVWGEPYHDNPDLQPELFVGRTPANSAYEISCWVEKTINYENGGVLQHENYINKALLTSADQMRDWNYGQGQDSLIAQYFPASVDVEMNSIQEYPSGDDPSPTQAPAPTFIEHFSEGWNFSAILAHGICDGFVTMSSGYNEWPKTYVWVGNGTDAVKGYLDNLENYGQAGIVYSIACSQGAFDYDQPPINAQNRCVGEWLVNLENRGAAAFIGYSRYGWVSSSYKLTEDFVEYAYQTDNRIGPANTYSKLANSYQRDLNYGLNLFGDPALPLWTEPPSVLQVSHPEIIALGENVINIEITSGSQAISGARVTIINSTDNLFMGQSGTDGSLEIEFNTGLDSMIAVTVTKPGYLPYQVNLTTSIALDADDGFNDRPSLPESFELYQNYPNPANPSTIVGFYLPRENDVRMELYNLLGQKLLVIDENGLPAGYHEIALDLLEYSSGVYFYRMITEEQVETKKLMLLK